MAWCFRKEQSLSDRDSAAFGIAAGVNFTLFLVTTIITGHVLRSRYFSSADDLHLDGHPLPSPQEGQRVRNKIQGGSRRRLR